MKKENKMALCIFLVFYILVGVLMTIFQERIVYYPNKQSFMNCASFKDAKKVEYKGTRMYVKDIDKPTVVLYHGNAGSACDRSFYADIFSRAGYGYIIVEYAGYSNDNKRPSHSLIKNDVQNVVSFIDENKIKDVTVVGESIGTGVASYHVSLKAPNKMILISPFTDLKDVASNHYWFYPTSLMVNNAFDNTKALKDYRGSTLVIHGNKDSIIPYDLGKKLFESLATKKQFVTIDGAGHNDMFNFPETYTEIANFLKK